MPLFGAIGKLLRLPWRDRFLLVETVMWLFLARVTILTVPFRHIAKLASVKMRGLPPSPDIRLNTLRRVQWAMQAAARRVPWRALCFEQGLAAQFMLRQRGIGTILYYGVAPDAENGLAAHVWVRDGDMDVVGGEAAPRFAVLATFPSSQSP